MKKTDFSKAVTSYLAEYLPQTCGFSDNTINSYRDAFKLLLLFLQEEKGIEAHKIELKMIGRQIVPGQFPCRHYLRQKREWKSVGDSLRQRRK